MNTNNDIVKGNISHELNKKAKDAFFAKLNMLVEAREKIDETIMKMEDMEEWANNHDEDLIRDWVKDSFPKIEVEDTGYKPTDWRYQVVLEQIAIETKFMQAEVRRMNYHEKYEDLMNDYDV